MYTRAFLFITAMACLLAAPIHAQSTFSAEKYNQILQENSNLSTGTLLSRHTPKLSYYKSQSPVLTGEYAYLDSIKLKLELTDSEMNLLRQNGFMASERLLQFSFRHGFTHIYDNDLPVFITTDAILQALHASYDRILMDMEMYRMRQNLGDVPRCALRRISQAGGAVWE